MATRVRLVDRDVVDSHRGESLDDDKQRRWQKVRGMVVTVGKPVEPNHTWTCGTDVIWPIRDKEYMRLAEIPESWQDKIFVCRHYIEAGD